MWHFDRHTFHQRVHPAIGLCALAVCISLVWSARLHPVSVVLDASLARKEAETVNTTTSVLHEPLLYAHEQGVVTPKTEVPVLEELRTTTATTIGSHSGDNEQSAGACNKKSITSFYIDPDGQAIRYLRALHEAGKEAEATLLQEIACEPLAVWLMGSAGVEKTRQKIDAVLATTQSTDDIPVFVLYNQPFHGAPGWASGFDKVAYHAWIDAIARAIGDREAWVILEPDALSTTAGYDTAGQNERLRELGRAVEILSRRENTYVYIDAGHSRWLSVAKAVELLETANIRSARGFSLNVSNYRSTEEELAYGRAIATAFPDAHFIIDTSRNGIGAHPDDEWCNAPDRAIGRRPERTSEDPALDAYLWVKPPGESDGTCNGGPPPGRFWLSYALELVRNTMTQ